MKGVFVESYALGELRVPGGVALQRWRSHEPSQLGSGCLAIRCTRRRGLRTAGSAAARRQLLQYALEMSSLERLVLRRQLIRR